MKTAVSTSSSLARVVRRPLSLAFLICKMMTCVLVPGRGSEIFEGMNGLSECRLNSRLYRAVVKTVSPCMCCHAAPASPGGPCPFLRLPSLGQEVKPSFTHKSVCFGACPAFLSLLTQTIGARTDPVQGGLGCGSGGFAGLVEAWRL